MDSRRPEAPGTPSIEPCSAANEYGAAANEYRAAARLAAEAGSSPHARLARSARAIGAEVRRVRAWLAAFAILAFVTACSSTSASPESTSKGPVEVRYRALARNVTFGIVNASHTDRTDLYSTSQPLDQATTKVSPDEVVDAMVEYFQEQGYFDIALTGAAPETPPPGATQILSLTMADGAYHAVLRAGVTPEFAAKFQACAKALQDVYNNTLQLQAVDQAPDWSGSSSRSNSNSKRSGG